jgi:hypothetical protein
MVNDGGVVGSKERKGVGVGENDAFLCEVVRGLFCIEQVHVEQCTQSFERMRGRQRYLIPSKWSRVCADLEYVKPELFLNTTGKCIYARELASFLTFDCRLSSVNSVVKMAISAEHRVTAAEAAAAKTMVPAGVPETTDMKVSSSSQTTTTKTDPSVPAIDLRDATGAVTDAVEQSSTNHPSTWPSTKDNGQETKTYDANHEPMDTATQDVHNKHHIHHHQDTQQHHGPVDADDASSKEGDSDSASASASASASSSSSSSSSSSVVDSKEQDPPEDTTDERTEDGLAPDSALDAHLRESLEQQQHMPTPSPTLLPTEVPRPSAQPTAPDTSGPVSSATPDSEQPAAQPQWWSSLVPSLFTTEQRAALEHDDPRTCDCKQLIFGERLTPVPEHHVQLLDALQLGTTTDSTGLFRQRLDHTLTAAGRHTLRKWLEYPLTNKTDIGLRRAMRVRLIGSDARPLRQRLSNMEHRWASVSWCWSDEKSKTELVDNLLFGGVFAPFNSVPLVQNLYHHMCVSGAPLVHCLGPLMPVLLTYMMMRWMGAGMSFQECWDMSTGILKNTLWFDDGSGGAGGHAAGTSGHLLGSLFGSQHGLSSVVPLLMKLLKWVWWIVFVANIVLMLYQCYRHYRLLSYVYSRVYRAASWLKTARELATVPAAENPDTERRIEALVRWCAAASDTFSVFTNAHDFLHAHSVLREPDVRSECERLLRQVGVIDALQSVDALLQRDQFTEPEALDAAAGGHSTTASSDDTRTATPSSPDPYGSPVCRLQRAFHPLLSSTDQTPQDLVLDKHVVLTGTNASGKSTVLKTLLLNVLLAQSWGVACAEHMTWTPFGNIRGYLHTVDDCGRESLFQAQVRRIEEFIEDARRLAAPAPPSSNGSPRGTISGHSLLVVDEILNSTNPIEAMLLSYQYAQIIGNELSGTTRMIMTTHYPALTTLAKAHPSTFENWAMRTGFRVGVGQSCRASSAIGTVQQMTRVLGEKEHGRLQKAYRRMYKRLVKMRFRELEVG